MTKLELKALKHTPARYMIDNTVVCEFANQVLMANPDLPVMQFNTKTKRWRRMLFKPGPFKRVEVKNVH